MKKRGDLKDKAQAALEFVMTYGWAILIVLIAIGVLAYFGVLNPERFLPHKCIISSGIGCLDYKVESYRVILVLQNSRGDALTINTVTVSVNDQECSDSQSITLNNYDKAVFTITQCNNGADGQSFNGAVRISYTLDERLSHNVTGTLRAKIVEGSSISSPSTCQNAENTGLCAGLDIVFGIGYKDACCNEHNLCC